MVETSLKISSDNLYVPVNSTVLLDSIVTDYAKPILAFTGSLFRELQYITTTHADSEYAVFLKIQKIDEYRPHFLAYEFFMPKQEASGGGVDLDPKDSLEMFKVTKLPHRFIAHLHSHGTMNVFWSAIDNEQQLSKNDLGFLDDYRFYIVVNAKSEVKCSLVVYNPVLTRVDAEVVLAYGYPDFNIPLTHKRKKELDALFTSQVTPKLTTIMTEGVVATEPAGAITLSGTAKYPIDNYFSDKYWNIRNPSVGGFTSARSKPADKPAEKTATTATTKKLVIPNERKFDINEQAYNNADFVFEEVDEVNNAEEVDDSDVYPFELTEKEMIFLANGPKISDSTFREFVKFLKDEANEVFTLYTVKTIIQWFIDWYANEMPNDKRIDPFYPFEEFESITGKSYLDIDITWLINKFLAFYDIKYGF